MHSHSDTRIGNHTPLHRNNFFVPSPGFLPQLMKPQTDIIAAGWNPVKEVLILKGASGRGKTQWATGQGSKVHLISHITDLATCRHDCDLLVFDHIMFGEGTQKQDMAGIVALTHRWSSRTVVIHNQNIPVPPAPRIFCVFEDESVFGDDPALGGHSSITPYFFVFDIDDHWGYCYYDSQVVDGITVPIIPLQPSLHTHVCIPSLPYTRGGARSRMDHRLA